MGKYKLLAVDIQNDFASPGGKCYTPKPSVEFLSDEIFPFLKERGIQILEIISDYRQPRPGDRGDLCYPGQWGYESLVPKDLVSSQWIKCMNSPLWIRENIGDGTKEPGLPYQDIEKFNHWLNENLGNPEENTPVLVGLTIDCCVLSTAQELSWHGYRPLIIKEAVDHASGKIEDRDKIINTPLRNWAKVVGWEEVKAHYENLTNR